MFWKKKKKNNVFECSQCGVIHDMWPALTYESPTPYHQLTDHEKKTIGKLNTDFCVIENQEQTDRFIRVVLSQKVIDYSQDLEYGVWVSLSEKSFNDYKENFNNEEHQTEYFGWLSNDIPQYDFFESIPMTVHTKKGNTRPEIIPHDDFHHPFIRDYYNGISKEEAETRIHQMMDRITNSNEIKSNTEG
ncbi:DUF2199 domain-containing protein [Aquimarina latercula]|uniref:DUF2199 domain-containing protein n=1 Tax=Aquimarina latercula TaxID=987 RepID=UPI00054D9533|nr:DUF2199 domain-containing protein [Aquimarina latercula]